MPAKLTTELFIAKARLIHGEYYDYSMVTYTNSKTHVTIVCPVHGPFSQVPNAHISGRRSACRSCTWKKRYPQNPAQSKDAKLKRRETCLVRYGREHPLCSGLPSRQKRNRTCVERYGSEHPMQNNQIAKKASDTWRSKSEEEISKIMNKKGPNPFLDDGIKAKLKKTREILGQWTPDDMLDELSKYRRHVWRESNKTYRKYKDIIDPLSSRGRKFHLDHKTPITIGFSEGWSIEKMSSLDNLQMLPASANLTKGNRWRD